LPDPRELIPGVWRWTADHPDWRADQPPGSPGDWPREVGSLLVDVDDTTVFFDPLVSDELWDRLDDHVRERGLPVSVLTTIGFHRRSRDAVLERYGATESVPAGVEALVLRGAGETMFWLPGRRALVVGDRLLGDERGGLRLCPESWLGYLPGEMTRAKLVPLLEPLLELPIEAVLVSHGEPVLNDGRDAIEAALAAV
jgi:hypothetical protein